MRRFVDLHTHSNASDGSYRPGELVAIADGKGLAAIALTDHDTTAGLAEAAEAAKRFPELRFVPGVEVSAKFSGSNGAMHLLGLGVDASNATLGGMLKDLREARDSRNPKIIAKLQALGIRVSMDDVLAVAGVGTVDGAKVVGRVHIAETLVRSGVVKTLKDAFERYLTTGAAAYVDKERLSPAAAIRAIRAAGGLAVLAHPVQLKCPDASALDLVLRRLMDDGLQAIEVYHSDHSSEQTRA